VVGDVTVVYQNRLLVQQFSSERCFLSNTLFWNKNRLSKQTKPASDPGKNMGNYQTIGQLNWSDYTLVEFGYLYKILSGYL